MSGIAAAAATSTVEPLLYGGAAKSTLLRRPLSAPSIKGLSVGLGHRTLRKPLSLECRTRSSSSDAGGTAKGGLTYKDAGVDIDAGSELVRRIAKMAPGIGGFGGLYPLGDSYLVAGTDGVGTKLKLAFETGIHDTIGIDLVAMSVNDIVTSGAKPLFFLDYFATSHLDVDLAERVIKGIVDGCQQSDCALLGGEVHTKRRNRLTQAKLNDLVYVMFNLKLKQREVKKKTVEDPLCLEDVDSGDEWISELQTCEQDAYHELDANTPLEVDAAEAKEEQDDSRRKKRKKDGEYDLSGFAVGIVKKDAVIDGKNIQAGDLLIGLPSSGVHSNGFSLVRRILGHSNALLSDKLPGDVDITLGEALMAPTVIYVKKVLNIISKGGVKGIAHITGGGFTDNIPRIFPAGLGARIFRDSWEIPTVFKWMQEVGGIEDAEMRRTFNMGIGMVLVVTPEASQRILTESHGKDPAYCIGEVIVGDGVTFT